MQLQIQISGIENGVLVMTAPKQQIIGRNQQPEQQQIPTTQYCEDFDSLVAYLKNVWPITVS